MEHKNTFHVIGVPIRTSPQNAMVEIGSLWERFMQEQVGEDIPNRIGDEYVVLYTDYEGDYTKPYTCILGHKVANLDTIPEGMVGREIESADYQVYSAKGEMPHALIDTWQKIWKTPADRAYKTDFEIYKDPTTVDVYVGIQSAS